MSACLRFRQGKRSPLLACEECGYFEEDHPARLTIGEERKLRAEIEHLREKFRSEADARWKTWAALSAALKSDERIV